MDVHGLERPLLLKQGVVLSCKSYHRHPCMIGLLLCITEIEKLYQLFKHSSGHNGTETFIIKWPFDTPVRSVIQKLLHKLRCKYM